MFSSVINYQLKFKNTFNISREIVVNQTGVNTSQRYCNIPYLFTKV